MIKAYKTLALALLMGAISTPSWGDFYIWDKDNGAVPITKDYKIIEWSGPIETFKYTVDLPTVTEIKKEYIGSGKSYIFYKE